MTGAMALHMLVAPHMLTAVLLGFLGVEAYASTTHWFLNNNQRIVG